MRAIVYDAKARPRTFGLRGVEKPEPADGEVLVRIEAVGLNAADYRSMKMGLIPESGIFGADVAGVVEAVGASVTRFTVGDAIVAETEDCGFGGLAEFVAVPERFVVPKPEALSFVDAAAMPMAAITALQALRDKGGVRQGSRVLIHGASGGVGTFAVQLAKHSGATVTAVCGASHADLVRSLGADRVIDYAYEDFAKDDSRYDIILAVQGSRAPFAYHKSLAKRGVVVVVGGALRQLFGAMIVGPLLSLGSRKHRVLAMKANAADLEFVLNLASEGKIRPVVEKTYPLEEATDAMRYLEGGHATGKIVVTT
jgi:NADPH:quinone reductase-like Zn-dependent oxidoreductase